MNITGILFSVDPFFYEITVSSLEDRELENPFEVSSIKKDGESSANSSLEVVTKKLKLKKHP